jgi:DNA polymerase delta subunit 2
MVEDHCVCGIPPQKVPLPHCGNPPPTYLALLSGINVGCPRYNPLTMQLCLEFLAGDIGDQELAARIARVVIAGNSIYPTEDIKSKDKIQLHTVSADSTTMVKPMKELDASLAVMASCVPIDVLPGDTDPTNCFLPQQPLHPCLLPQTSIKGNANFTTNPYQVNINGLTIIGTSGQTLDDIGKYAAFDSPLEILERTLHWRHIAPTVPDTLAVYPYFDQDPFALRECPHLYFVGNQPKFETKLVSGFASQQCRLVCVPCFSETPGLVLVDMNSEDLHTTFFRISTII